MNPTAPAKPTSAPPRRRYRYVNPSTTRLLDHRRLPRTLNRLDARGTDNGGIRLVPYRSSRPSGKRRPGWAIWSADESGIWRRGHSRLYPINGHFDRRTVPAKALVAADDSGRRRHFLLLVCDRHLRDSFQSGPIWLQLRSWNGYFGPSSVCIWSSESSEFRISFSAETRCYVDCRSISGRA